MNTQLFKQLCEATGASGFEYGIRDLIIEVMTPLADEITVDNIGNVTALIKGKSSAKSIMCAAHMDEIGFIVRHIDDNGFIRILPLGGFDPKTLTAQRVIVHGKKDLPGCMGVKPIHVMSPEERTKMPAVTDYVVDLGMSKEEVEKYVSIGDSITRVGDMIEMGDCLNVKSIDNRGGCYLLIEAIRAIKAAGKTPDYDLYAVFSVQEEVGLRGAQAATLAIAPTFAFALDVTIAFDTPGSGAHDKCTVLGKGTAVKVYDGTLITDSRMVKFMTALCEENNIPYQLELLAAGGTDAGAMQKFTAGGAITGAISIPVRNVHQSIEMAHKTDIQASVDLLEACFTSLDRWDWSWKRMERTLAPVQKAAPKKCAAKRCASRKNK
ncbi:MAG: M42 family metallopeptidase [Akkermansia sp.]|nr:M42 family metallopeptidase [Akkermansia sp.]